MRASHKFLLILTLLPVVIWFETLADAATFTVTPSVISNTFFGVVSLSIGGLTNGESVTVDTYLDANTNSLVDTNDLLIESHKLIDGVQALIGGKTNINVPSDWTPTNAAITAYLNFFTRSLHEGVGNYLLRLSSPSGRFTPLTNNFTVTNSTFPRAISGNVTSTSTNVSFASVILLSAGRRDFVTFTVADTNGHYSVRVPAGAYQLLALRPGYICEFANAPVVTVSNVDLATNLTLLSGNRTLAGRVLDAGNTNIGLAGLPVFFSSAGGKFVLACTGSNGVFSATATSDIWQAGQDGFALASLGYIEPSDDFRPQFDTSTGSVSTAQIKYTRGTAMFYGRILDQTNGPLRGVLFFAQDQNNFSNPTLSASAWSDTNGNYCALATATNWDVEIDNNNSVLTNYVTGSGSGSINLLSNQAYQFNFSASLGTTTIKGKVKDNSNVPVIGLTIQCSQDAPPYYRSSAQTDLAGNYSCAAVAGNWRLHASCDGENGLKQKNYNCAPDQFASAGATGVNFTVYPLGSATFSGAMVDNGLFTCTVNAASGFSYYVQMSTNLLDWSTVFGTNNLPGDSFMFQDDASSDLMKFYRTVRF